MVLAYVAHGLRGADVDVHEAGRVARLALSVGAEHLVLPVTVVRGGGGLESDAREARHVALESEAERRGVRFVLHGHHAEDQAETVLLRLARGTGVDGLAGMAAVAGRRLRPLLDVRRADLHRVAELVAPGVLADASHDPMNDDTDIARVRLRREVLPALGRIAPDPVGALARLAALARDEGTVLDATVDALRATLPVVTFGRATLVPSDALRRLPDALGRRVVRTMLPEGEARSASSVERVLRAPDGWRATLPGPLDVSIDRGWLVVLPAAEPRAGAAPAVDPFGPPLELPLDGVMMHAPSGMTLRCSAGPGPDGPTATAVLTAEPSGGVPPGLDVERLSVRLCGTGALHVRERRAGDRVRLAGGTRMLGDVLADAGVPLTIRDLLPVVVDAADRVRWVPGVAVDADAHDGRAGGDD